MLFRVSIATGAKSRTGSKGMGDAMLWRFITWVDTTASRVWPSGSARATASEPTTPAAPARFSTTMGCGRAGRSASATARARMSVPPPAA